MKSTILTVVALLAIFALPALTASGKATAAKSKSPMAEVVATERKSPTASAEEKVPAKQGAAKKLASDLTSTQETKLLAFLNEASVKELAVVKGISTTRGAAIEKARPFKTVEEVILITGIGESTFAELVKHGKTLTRSRSSSSTSSRQSS